ncbi:MAG TPA: NUDIX hydrolase [Capillimicrobium sp.]|nr:NUDIX hydrolase [Capillimicrobium sp.]
MEELNATGAETPPRPASTVIVVRGGATGLEVLLVQRNPQARFMGGAWVFPGGAVDPGESDEAAAVRELREEAAIEVEPDALVPFSRWITPALVKVRFDTRFFVTALPPGSAPGVDGSECVALDWFAPQQALDAHARGELLLVFPTIKHLEQLTGFPSADAVLDHARASEVRPVLPRVLLTGEHARIVLPGDPEY